MTTGASSQLASGNMQQKSIEQNTSEETAEHRASQTYAQIPSQVFNQFQHADEETTQVVL